MKTSDYFDKSYTLISLVITCIAIAIGWAIYFKTGNQNLLVIAFIALLGNFLRLFWLGYKKTR